MEVQSSSAIPRARNAASIPHGTGSVLSFGAAFCVTGRAGGQSRIFYKQEWLAPASNWTATASPLADVAGRC
uniref:Uncharacterized protein n=1 Tax=Oryza glumipatula TaxID=40148 RepID=A0A0E0B860_9ORYZ